MEGIEHRTIKVNGINMHVAEKGQGPVILFLHGFPELWYTWRHQIHALASLGYRAVAPDLRGYGDTDAPADPSSYTYLHVVGDLVALLDAIAADQVFVVGHDWGAIIAWYLCLFRPDRVKALVNLSVAFSPRNPQRKPLEALRAVYGDDYYVCRFQVLRLPP
jgi:pimeloyl-ACP methyl ester carboxylesterase